MSVSETSAPRGADSLSPDLRSYHQALGIPDDYAKQCRLPFCAEPSVLVDTEPDYYGRPQQLVPEACAAWQAMRDAAATDGVVIHLISAFRGFSYQFELLKRKLEAGEQIEQILTINAAPGFSEHHTGRAVDLGTLNCPALEQEFERTDAFAWLVEHAAEYGFSMSYPRGNQLGICYEPWHWCFAASDQ